MTVYVDILFAINLYFDFLLLLTVNITLKRNAKLKRIILASIVGSSSIITLFFSFQTISLFVYKLFLSLVMILLAFGVKDKKYIIENLAYFYMTSTILGGFLYYLNLNFADSKSTLNFMDNSFNVNYIFLMIISPIILYLYIKQRKEKSNYDSILPVTFYFKNGGELKLNGFLDTGNKLKDPITKKYVILVKEDLLKISSDDKKDILYVPFNSLNNHGLIKCLRISSVKINNHISSKYIIGLSDSSLLKNGIDCVLNAHYMEEN